MIANKKEFSGGILLMAGFWVLFALFMSPVFRGQNLLDFMDSLYNSISKNSAYYIPETNAKSEAFKGTIVNLKMTPVDKGAASRMPVLLREAGATMQGGGEEIEISGDLGFVLSRIIADADVMYANNGEAMQSRYGFNGKQVMVDWWNIMQAMEKALTKQGKFVESKMLYQARTKVVEPAYNYYGVQAKSIKEKLSIVILSLAGYVVYTMWFGFAILFIFEGWGLKLEH
jgi:hypothetical protein